MDSKTSAFDQLVDEALNIPFSGWDFSIMHQRWKTVQPSWDYPQLARRLVRGTGSMLDQDTGGGELLASLAPLPPLTWATEYFPPNIPIARSRLEPLGVKVITDGSVASIPLPNSSLDLVLNRHGGYSESELFRLLKPGGVFLTQQVGGQNCIRLNELLQDEVDFEYSYWTSDYIRNHLEEAGFQLRTIQEEFPPADFMDIGAVVFYLRIISWQVADFSVDKYRSKLYAIHQHILEHGSLRLCEHRILVKARKPAQ